MFEFIELFFSVKYFWLFYLFPYSVDMFKILIDLISH